MGTFRELPVISDPAQSFSTVLSGRTCSFTLRYSTWSNRWSFDLTIDGVTMLQGRRIVLGVDLLAPFSLDIGKLFAVDWEDKGVEPGRTELPSGQVRLLHYDEADVAA
jgi:hypothetical protein